MILLFLCHIWFSYSLPQSKMNIDCVSVICNYPRVIKTFLFLIILKVNQATTFLQLKVSNNNEIWFES